jgi:hypothetical protein
MNCPLRMFALGVFLSAGMPAQAGLWTWFKDNAYRVDPFTKTALKLELIFTSREITYDMYYGSLNTELTKLHRHGLGVVTDAQGSVTRIYQPNDLKVVIEDHTPMVTGVSHRHYDIPFPFKDLGPISTWKDDRRCLAAYCVFGNEDARYKPGYNMVQVELGHIYSRNEEIKVQSAYRVRAFGLKVVAVVAACSVLYKYRQVIGRKVHNLYKKLTSQREV